MAQDGHCGARCGIPRSARPAPDRSRRGLPGDRSRRSRLVGSDV